MNDVFQSMRPMAASSTCMDVVKSPKMVSHIAIVNKKEARECVLVFASRAEKKTDINICFN